MLITQEKVVELYRRRASELAAGVVVIGVHVGVANLKKACGIVLTRRLLAQIDIKVE